MGFSGDIFKTADLENRTDCREQPPSGPSSARPFRWVPIRSLSARHRPRIVAHLLALPDSDRYLRFGYAASDAQVARYADLIDFSHDEVFGIFNRRLELLAMAHLAMQPAHGESAARRRPSSASPSCPRRVAAAMAAGYSTTPCCMRATATSTRW